MTAEKVPLFLHFPLHLNALVSFGLILLLGLIGGEIARRSRFLPRITGYILVGFIIGMGGFNIVNPELLANSRIFIEISLGLILFDLGRHLDFRWLQRDHGLLLMALAESFLTFISIFIVLCFIIKLPYLLSAFAAIIAVATSPAVLMMITHDLSSEGPVTRRALILTSLNNFFALLMFTFLLPLAKADTSLAFTFWLYSGYRLFGSIILGFLVFSLTKLIASLVGKYEKSQFILFVGTVVLTMGLTEFFSLSSFLTLFSLGVAARNFDYKHILMEVDFGWLARVFFILLFVTTGMYLQLQGLWQATLAVLTFVFIRILAKMGGICLFAKASRLTSLQTFTLGLTLFPMAGVAIGMANTLVDVNPDFSNSLLPIVTAAVAVLDIIGPIVTQFAFIKSGEANSAQPR